MSHYHCELERSEVGRLRGALSSGGYQYGEGVEDLYSKGLQLAECTCDRTWAIVCLGGFVTFTGHSKSMHKTLNHKKYQCVTKIQTDEKSGHSFFPVQDCVFSKICS